MKLAEINTPDVSNGVLDELLSWASDASKAITAVTGGMTIITVTNPSHATDGYCGRIICEMQKGEDLEFFSKIVEKALRLHPTPYVKLANTKWTFDGDRLNGNVNVKRLLQATSEMPQKILPAGYERSAKAEP